MISRVLISSQVASKQIGREPIWVAAMGKLIASIMTPFKCLQFNEPFVIHTSADDAKNSEDVQGSGARFLLVSSFYLLALQEIELEREKTHWNWKRHRTTAALLTFL